MLGQRLLNQEEEQALFPWSSFYNSLIPNGIWCFATIIAPRYILNQIELEAKGYETKNSIANLINQLSCTSDATNVLEYSNQGTVLLILVSKQNLKPLLLVHLTQ
jgi:hypothetical protein